MTVVLRRHEAEAVDRLPAVVHDYYAGGSGTEVTLSEASAAWQAVRLRPRVLRDVAHVDTSTTLLGQSLATPVLVAPSALQALAHPEGELAAAGGARDAGALFVLSTRSTSRIEDVAQVSGAWWFQVYAMRDRGLTHALVERAVAAGASGLVLTGDTPYVGLKARAGRGDMPVTQEQYLVNLAQHLAAGEDVPVAERTEQDPSVGLELIGELAQAGVPVLVKGVLRGDDAVACLDAGAGGVIVSNHGGRQLDRALPTARALPEVADAVAGRAPVLVDGGIRSGLDVLCALALGADAVLVGRPVLWALACGGAPEVTSALESLRADLAHVMALAGAPSVADVGRDLIA